MQPTPSTFLEIQGMNVLLMGPQGSGKTTSITTLLQVPNLRIFCEFTEPRFDILGQEFLNNPRVHWHYTPPVAAGWATLIQNAKQVNTMTNEALQKMTSVEGAKYVQFISLLQNCNDFVDQHGQHHGDVMQLGTDCVYVIDGLSGINRMARGLKVGAKVALTQPDWGACQQVILSFVEALTTNTKCHFVLIAHVERELDETMGGSKIMVRTLGRKLAPALPDNFSDIILTAKVGDKFFWDTANPQADLKTGFSTLGSALPPSFVPLFHAWNERVGKRA